MLTWLIFVSTDITSKKKKKCKTFDFKIKHCESVTVSFIFVPSLAWYSSISCCFRTQFTLTH